MRETRYEKELRRAARRKKIKIAVMVLCIIAITLIGAKSALYFHQHPSYSKVSVPEYSGKASVILEKGQPSFTERQIKHRKYEKFSKLDGLGRCGVATACIGPESMPEGERGPIGAVRPSGWKIKKYDFIDNGGYLYNRCHLVGWQLTGQNAEVRNLITGTRYLNTEGMLPYENQVASYIRRTGHHVMYRVTPYFKGNELVCRGVQIEALSVEDGGKGISFNVYCYNVQPGVEINYKNGESEIDHQ